MKHFVVVNPHSFKTSDGLKSVVAEFENCFSESKAKYDIYISRYPRDAVAAVNRYMLSAPASETVRIYAVGGDGILFDCLNGMVPYNNAQITSVPFGKANDFVRAFGEDAAPSFRNIKKIIAGSAFPVDALFCGSNYVINQVNIGLIGLSSIRANMVLHKPSWKWSHRFAPQIYTAAGLSSIWDKNIMRQEYKALLDGEDVSGKYANIHVANGPCNGGNMLPSPYAVPNDGLMDIIFTAKTSSINVLRTLGSYKNGTFERHGKIFRHRRGRKLEVFSDNTIYVELDGESFCAREITIELVPGKIKFFAQDGVSFADYTHRAYKISEKKMI